MTHDDDTPARSGNKPRSSTCGKCPTCGWGQRTNCTVYGCDPLTAHCECDTCGLEYVAPATFHSAFGIEITPDSRVRCIGRAEGAEQ